MHTDTLVTDDDIESANVHLKPILGIAPGRYLAAGGLLLIAVVLFLLLVMPGLKNPGTVYTFSSAPSGAAVFVDGSFAGATPCDLFLSKGDHDIRVSQPSFSEANVSRVVPGRLFASLFFPRRESVRIRLSLADGGGLWRDAVKEFSAWNLSGDPSSVWQAPPTLESAAQARFADGSAQAPSWEERRDFVLAAARVTTGTASAEELIRAAAFVFGSGNLESPDVAEGWRKIFSEVPEFSALLSELAPEASRSLPLGSDVKRSAAVPPTPSRFQSPSLVVRSVRFLSVSTDGSTPFYLAEKETTVREYSAFLRENSRWAPANRDALIAEGLVTEDYLAGFLESDPDEPVSGVSWYAASAYAGWLNGSAPSGLTATLPGEAEWERASRAGGSTGAPIWLGEERRGPAAAGIERKDRAGFSDLMGNLWEWCADSYAVHPEIGRTAALRFPSSERSVRGGCWANPPGSVTETTRGSFPPEWCSPFLGFRVALYPSGSLGAFF